MVVLIRGHLSFIQKVFNLLFQLLWVHILYQVTSQKGQCIVCTFLLSLAGFIKNKSLPKSEELVIVPYFLHILEGTIYCYNEMLNSLHGPDN